MEEIKLNRVRICGFKSIKSSEVTLQNINVLIGPNGSGKSNFVSANKQIILSTQSTELLDYFNADDIIVTEMTENGSKYTRLSQDRLKEWLKEYSISAIWKKNVFGGQPFIGNGVL